MHGRTQHNGYFPHIDGLRAVAVLAVILYHLKASWLPGGFTGVDVFFVISGFVVSASVARLPSMGFGAEMLRFYARRMRRIMPALLVCLLSTAVLSALFIPESWLSETSTKTGRMAFVGLSNWVLASTGSDYFSPRSDYNPYAHTWSLGVEEQFYLLFPLLFLAWGRGGGKRWLSLSLFAVATAGSLAYALLRSRQLGHEIESFYLTTTRFWQLGVGVLLFQLMDITGRFNAPAQQRRKLGWQSPLLLASVVLLGYGLWKARPGHSPWPDGLWPALATLGLLGLLHSRPEGWLGRALSAAPVVMIGRMSYSLYLWHWPVFVLFRWTIDLETLVAAAMALSCTAVLAWLSWRWVEQPIRSGNRWRATDARWVAVGLGVLVFGALLQSQLDKGRRYISLSTVSRNPKDWYAYAKGLSKEFPDCRLAVTREPLGARSVQRFERADCPAGAPNTRQLFVVGDSHALAYGEMLRRLTLSDGGITRLYGSGGCAVAGLQGRQRNDPGCAGYVRDALQHVLAHAQPGDVLFLPGLRVLRMVDQYELFDPEEVMRVSLAPEAQRVRDEDVIAAIEQLRPLAERGIRIVLEAPKPVLLAPPYRCSDAFNRDNPICVHGIPVERSRIETLRAPVVAGLQQIAGSLPGASVWDPMPILCPGQTCEPDQDGRPLYFDADHLSGHGNRTLLPFFREHLRSLSANAQQRNVARH